MGDEDATTNLVYQISHIGSYQLLIVSSRVWGDLTEELFQCLCRLWKLAAVLILRPYTHTEILKPELVVCRCFDGFVYRTASGTSTARLVYQVGTESPTQENCRKSLAAVRRTFPRLGGLPGSVQEYEWILASIDWDLIRHVGVVAVQGLAVSLQWLVRVVSARLRLYRTTNQETALLTDGKEAVIRHFLLCLG